MADLKSGRPCPFANLGLHGNSTPPDQDTINQTNSTQNLDTLRIKLRMNVYSN